jgi:ATP-dependent RNA helicase RhlE
MSFKKKSTRTVQNTVTHKKKRSSHTNNKQRSHKRINNFNPTACIAQLTEEKPIFTPDTISHTFADFSLESRLAQNISLRGYKHPTAIQDQVIPHILKGTDVVATAHTGTGKTAAFLIPLVHNIVTKKTKRVLIIVPTRELALQIHQELDYFKKNMHISSAVCIGGLSLRQQVQQLYKNPEFVIATPGRLIDLVKQNALDLGTFSTIVLDEVDVMLDMGFIKDIKLIISALPKKRHALFFSATISPDFTHIMNMFLHNPVSINVKKQQAVGHIDQQIVKIDPKRKVDQLHDILIRPECIRVIIFLRTKWNVDKLTKMLIERGFKVAGIHGDKTQAARRRALDQFKADQIKILLATDVLARGIDIADVSHVINYDTPETQEDYVHRIGRTGRAEKSGCAITFVN